MIKRMIFAIEFVVIIGNLFLDLNKLFVLLTDEVQEYQSKCALRYR